jgi:hypothetical protein
MLTLLQVSKKIIQQGKNEKGLRKNDRLMLTSNKNPGGMDINS